jgi:hypothetical protein
MPAAKNKGYISLKNSKLQINLPTVLKGRASK